MNAADPFVELARVLRELPSACSDACGCTRGAALLKTTFPFGGAVAVNRELLDELLDAGLLDLAGELVGRHDRHDRGAQLTALFAIMDWAFWMRDDARYRGSPHMGRLGALALPIVEAYEARSDELFAHDQLVDDSLGPVIVLVLAWLGNPPYAPRRGEAISDAAIRMMVAVYMSSSVAEPERIWAALPRRERFEGDRATRGNIIDYAVTGLRAAVSELADGGRANVQELVGKASMLLYFIVPLSSPEVAAEMATRGFGRLLAELLRALALAHARRGGDTPEHCDHLRSAISMVACVLRVRGQTDAAQQELDLVACSMIDGGVVEVMLASLVHSCSAHAAFASDQFGEALNISFEDLYDLVTRCPRAEELAHAHAHSLLPAVYATALPRLTLDKPLEDSTLFRLDVIFGKAMGGPDARCANASCPNPHTEATKYSRCDRCKMSFVCVAAPRSLR